MYDNRMTKVQLIEAAFRQNERIVELEEDLRGREAVADSYATENQRLHDRAERAEAERDAVRELLEMLQSAQWLKPAQRKAIRDVLAQSPADKEPA